MKLRCDNLYNSHFCGVCFKVPLTLGFCVKPDHCDQNLSHCDQNLSHCDWCVIVSYPTVSWSMTQASVILCLQAERVSYSSVMLPTACFSPLHTGWVMSPPKRLSFVRKVGGSSACLWSQSVIQIHYSKLSKIQISAVASLTLDLFLSEGHT